MVGEKVPRRKNFSSVNIEVQYIIDSVPIGHYKVSIMSIVSLKNNFLNQFQISLDPHGEAGENAESVENIYIPL